VKGNAVKAKWGTDISISIHPPKLKRNEHITLENMVKKRLQEEPLLSVRKKRAQKNIPEPFLAAYSSPHLFLNGLTPSPVETSFILPPISFCRFNTQE